MQISERMKRLPPYALGKVRAMMMEERAKGVDVIDLGMGNPDQPTPVHIIEKMCQVAHDPKAHRYSASKGILHLRRAICERYQQDFGVELDSETEAIVTIGAKEGISHLMLALLDPGDVALVPEPAYPIHMYSVVIAGANVVSVPLRPENNFVLDLDQLRREEMWPKPKVLVLNYPHNPTTAVVDLSFFEKVVAFAKEKGMIVIHDLAYKDLYFDGCKPPSFLQVKGAKDVGVEFFSLTKSYNMAGWRVGFCLGNPWVIKQLTNLKGYLDYGIFTPIQVASITALRGEQSCAEQIRKMYQSRRDVLVEGLNKIGWKVEKPKATMFIWAPVPEKFRSMNSLDFSIKLLKEGAVVVSPGIGFGEHGEGYVRFALVENEMRTQQAIRNMRRIFQ